jgi:nitrogen regulatory protein PII
MKLIRCIVRPGVVTEAVEELEKLGVSGVTVSEVRGRGLHTRPTGTYRGASYQQMLPMAMIDVVASDEAVDDVVDAVLALARTGHAGDGRVFVMPVEVGYTVRTREAEFA